MIDPIDELMEKQVCSKVINVRLTPKEKKDIAEKCKITGLSTSEYIRKVVRGEHPRAAMTKEEMDFYGYLSEIVTFVRKFGYALKEVTKDMTKEQRDSYILDMKTVTEWSKVVYDIDNFWKDFNKRITNKW